MAVTEKEAGWPAVTVWLVGSVPIDGATGARLLVLATIPEHPEFTIATSTTSKTRAPRFIVCLFHELFSGAWLVDIATGHPAGEYLF